MGTVNSNGKTPYFYAPDEFVDLGLLGEHPIEFQCWITWRGTETQPLVEIATATVKFMTGGELSVTALINSRDYIRERWHLEIIQDYLKPRTREWEPEDVA